MSRSRLLIRLGLVAFVVLALLGAYFFRKSVLEKNLIAAMEMNDEKAVRDLLWSFPSPANGRDAEGRTALHRMVEGGSKDIVILLIIRGADVNARDGDGRTPLHWAAADGYMNKVELLLASGADPNAKDKNNTTPLHWALMEGNKDIADLLVEKGAQGDIFTAAGLGEWERVIRLLNQNRTLVDAKMWLGLTPLYFAARCGQAQTAGCLIAWGADANAKDALGQTPIHEAAFGGNTQVMQLLITKGAQVNVKDRRDATPLHYAVLKGHIEVARLLLDNGADANAKNRNGDTPLKLVHDRNDIADLLRKHGAKE